MMFIKIHKITLSWQSSVRLIYLKSASIFIGRDLDIGLRTFGWHIYGEDDVDHNEYPGKVLSIVHTRKALIENLINNRQTRIKNR